MKCEGCHVEIARRMRAAAHAHPAVRAGHGKTAVCLDCHAFHDAKEKFLMSDPTASCAICHPASIREESHPVGVANARTGRPITCTSECHDPHGSPYRWFCRMEPGRALCLDCHEEMK